MADAFSRQRAIWLKDASKDLRLTAQAFRTAFVLADFFNRTTWDAWPSQKKLAKLLDVSRNGLKNSLRQLAELGYIGVEVNGAKPGDVNRYRMVPRSAERGNERDPMRGNENDPIEDAEGVTPVTLRGQPGDAKGQRECPQPILEDLQEDLLEERDISLPEVGTRNSRDANLPALLASQAKEPADAAFEVFWNTYPRRVGKEAARREFAAILKRRSATADELIAGSARYAQARAGQDPRFTKHPGTWLRAGCWTDEPDAIGSNVVFWPGTAQPARQSAVQRAHERLAAARVEAGQ